MQDRKTLLETILRLKHPEMLKQLAAALRKSGWDSPEGELVNLTWEHVVSILRRYLAGELSEAQVEDWANLVELREDITYGIQDDNEVIIDAINDLANPVLEGNLMPESAKALIEDLRTASVVSMTEG